MLNLFFFFFTFQSLLLPPQGNKRPNLELQCYSNGWDEKYPEMNYYMSLVTLQNLVEIGWIVSELRPIKFSHREIQEMNSKLEFEQMFLNEQKWTNLVWNLTVTLKNTDKNV